MGAVLSKFIVFASMVKVKADFEKYQHTKKACKDLNTFTFTFVSERAWKQFYLSS